MLDHLPVGTEVSFDDGRLRGVVEMSQPGSVVVRVERAQRKGFKMKPERGLTFPGADLHLDPLTPDDLTGHLIAAAAACFLVGSQVQAQQVHTLAEDAAAFGARDGVRAMAISPDGT